MKTLTLFLIAATALLFETPAGAQEPFWGPPPGPFGSYYQGPVGCIGYGSYSGNCSGRRTYSRRTWYGGGRETEQTQAAQQVPNTLIAPVITVTPPPSQVINLPTTQNTTQSLPLQVGAGFSEGALLEEVRQMREEGKKQREEIRDLQRQILEKLPALKTPPQDPAA